MPTPDKVKYYYIYFAWLKGVLMAIYDVNIPKRPNYAIHLKPNPKGPKFSLFMVLTLKLLECVINAEPTQNGIIYKIFMVNTQKWVKYAINRLLFILFLLKRGRNV